MRISHIPSPYRRIGLAALKAAATLTAASVLAAVASAPAARAQTPGSAVSADNPAPVTAPTYRIAPEDMLDISVVGQNGYGVPGQSRTVTVLADGTTDLPYLGEKKVSGLTLSDLRKKIMPAAAKELLNPLVTIAVRARFVKQVNVFGGVLPTRGKIALRENWRVRDVISAAGGFPSDRYEFYKAVFLKMRTGERIEIDLKKLLEDGDQTQNFVVEENDVLDVQPLKEEDTQVQIVGQVAKPGPVMLPRSGSVLEALQQAGGPTPRAALADVIIRRGGKVITLDLRDYDKTGFTSPETLHAGDTLVVPENVKVFYINGAVGRAGAYPYPEDEPMTVYKAIAITGGQTQGSELREVLLTHKNADKTTTKKTIDVDKMLRTGNLKGDVAVAPDDVIFVPPYKKRNLGLGEALTALSAAGSAFYLFDRLFKH